jgi:dTDP-4-amino-4,6-dideoxygalactose transaminase
MILQTNPKRSYEKYKTEIEESISRVLNSGQYILGNEVSAFEKEFSKFNNSNFSIGVGNGTDAITIALLALGIGYGDEVITTSHTAVATVSGIISTGATPVVVDINPETYLIDVLLIENAITPRTKAIIPVHLYGKSVDMTQLMEIATKHHLSVVEDCSQAHGAEHSGTKVGNFGEIGTFSCYPTKNLGAIGDAGIIVTSDFELSERIRRIRQYGWKERNLSLEFGLNSRLDEVQASILRIKLKYLNENNLARMEKAKVYSDAFRGLPLNLQEVQVPSEHVYHQYVISVESRNQLMEKLLSDGIQTAIHYPLPVHKMVGYSERIISSGVLNQAENACKKVLSLPIYPELTHAEQQSVIKSVEKCLSD